MFLANLISPWVFKKENKTSIMVHIQEKKSSQAFEDTQNGSAKYKFLITFL